MSKSDLKSLPEPGNKYKLGLKIGGGVGGEVFEAVENQTGKKVAIKIIELKKETEDEIQQECQVLKDMSGKENFPEFYGIYSKKGKDNSQKIWLVLEFCGGGEATSLVRKLEMENKKLSELHIAYIIRETIKGGGNVNLQSVIHLRENDVSHRDVRGSNILLTDDGRVKLVDYGISKRVDKSKKLKTCVGSPNWLAPEVILCQTERESGGYDEKADVWAVGITAIELGEGQAPFEDTHPGRALFQIVNNPPPTLRKPSDWSQLYNDFISECLVKNPENRPFAQELLAHPFFEPLDQQPNLLDDLNALLEKYKSTNLHRKPEVQVRGEFLKIEGRPTPEKILHEDLAAMKSVTEDSVLFELQERLKRNEFQTFVGDVMLILNPNKSLDVYGSQHHQKYRFKAKSQNAPHIYAIAESAYRDVFHHEKPQHVLFTGETGAGKTANMIHATDHLLYLGQGLKTSRKVAKALEVIHAMGNAATPHNNDSTRHVLQTQMTFTDTGKVSGAVFRLYLLEKERVTMATKKQSNFHLFHYFYDAMKSWNELTKFHLGEEDYNFLKTDLAKPKNTKENITRYKSFEDNLKELGFDDGEVQSIRKTLAAIVLMGEIEFRDGDDGEGVLASPETVKNVADLLGVDRKKFSWALLNYCLIANGEAVMRHNSKQEADDGRNVLGRGLYSRLVDWVVNAINEKISVSRVIYGDSHVISLLDLYGFECYKRNTLSQLFVNTINEQLQVQYNQKIFTWDKQTADEEDIPFPNLQFKDNKIVTDLIMSKPDGLLHKIDEATRKEDSSNLLSSIARGKDAPVFAETSREFSIQHYTGKITYDASDMAEKNRDFLPPEIIETMRLSSQELTKQLFSSLLSRSGNLSREPGRRFGNEDGNKKNDSNAPPGQFSQSRQMRTAATTFRDASADLFRNFADKECGFHFVRCVRTDLTGSPGGFDVEIVRQQLRALAVVNTALTIQRGYSYSVLHEEFIRRYKFLAFDFDENVEETKDNCRLLLLRLKLEGWTMGKTRVFLKYYNREYLSRLYEMQIKKIVKVQSMMRTFMARRKLYAKIKKYQVDADKNKPGTEGNESAMEARAARIIQKRFREYASCKCSLTESQKEFIRPWYKRWRTKSIFQVLLLYRAERLQALVNFFLQIHLYNQNHVTNVQKTNHPVSLESVEPEAKPTEFLPPLKPTIPKLLFLWKSLNPRDDISNCEPLPERNLDELEVELRANSCKKSCLAAANTAEEENSDKHFEDKGIQTSMQEENTSAQKDIITQLPRQESNESKNQEQREETPIQDSIPVAKKQQNVTENPTPDANKEENPIPRPTILIPKSRPPPVKPRSNSKTKLAPVQNLRTSLTEMEERFKNKNYNGNSDDPPFDFRSLLKKTNYSMGPRKTSYEDKTFQKEIAEFSFAERKKSASCGGLSHLRKRSSDAIVTELAPGILIYGKATDL